MGATVLLERRDKGEKYIESAKRERERRAAARTYVRRPPTHPSLHPRLLSTTGTSKPSHGVVAANLVCELQNPPPPTRAYK
ncbi:hypothetical protein ALC62_13844 [Cyphomyrmex costatus]|uniref:Uncharacterized protein n=1 Tax=Cyphomyrmex costatus TaxID=456900 RepID=A0A195C5F6_9HYME|nr:hypothetical protein ALC62_13844 [Cyphomyrmex costatus]